MRPPADIAADLEQRVTGPISRWDDLNAVVEDALLREAAEALRDTGRHYESLGNELVEAHKRAERAEAEVARLTDEVAGVKERRDWLTEALNAAEGGP